MHIAARSEVRWNVGDLAVSTKLISQLRELSWSTFSPYNVLLMEESAYPLHIGQQTNTLLTSKDVCTANACNGKFNRFHARMLYARAVNCCVKMSKSFQTEANHILTWVS